MACVYEFKYKSGCQPRKCRVASNGQSVAIVNDSGQCQVVPLTGAGEPFVLQCGCVDDVAFVGEGANQALIVLCGSMGATFLQASNAQNGSRLQLSASMPPGAGIRRPVVARSKGIALPLAHLGNSVMTAGENLLTLFSPELQGVVVWAVSMQSSQLELQPLCFLQIPTLSCMCITTSSHVVTGQYPRQVQQN